MFRPYRLITPVSLATLASLVGAACLAAACGGDEPGPDPTLDGGSSSSTSGAASSSSSSGSSGASSSSGSSGTSSGDDGGSSSSGGDGGSDLRIEAPARTWTWIDFPESRCRNGSATGIGVNLNPGSDKVMIYLQGGGACFNSSTCAGNPQSFSAANLGDRSTGIFDRGDTENPVKDFNMVFVPYCTGDVHAGNAENVMVDGVTEPQQFVGYANIGKYLTRIVPTFPNATQVLLTGESAGGFGSAANYDHVQNAFGTVPVALVDDSGPTLDSSVVAPCLQQQWREYWGLDDTLLADCGAGCNDPNDFLTDYVASIRARHPNLRAGLISSTSDQVIRGFFGFSANNCTAQVPNTTAPAFAAALQTFRTAVQTPGPAFGTFYIDSTKHTWLSSEYTRSEDGVQMRAFVGNVLSGGPAQHLGPD